MKIIETQAAPQPIGPYSQGIEIDNFIFFSGQIGLRPDTGEMSNEVVQQTHQILRNISDMLQSIGLTLSNVVKSTVYLRDMNDFAKFNQAYSEYFKDHPPARTTVEVSSLPRNALIEIDIIAHK